MIIYKKAMEGNIERALSEQGCTFCTITLLIPKAAVFRFIPRLGDTGKLRWAVLGP